MNEWAGRSLSKVVLEEPLGRGGMAEVYLGRHSTLNIPVAVKILYAHLSEDDDLRRRFTAEAQSVASLRHSNIVHVYDFDVVDGRPYIVMELLDGKSLEVHLSELGAIGLSLPLPTIARLTTDLASALDYAHAKGIVHRDVKPANVILRAGAAPILPGLPLPPDVQPILTDFGIAHIAGAGSQTASGDVLGTPAYMSPEQARGGVVDARSDVYSLGVVLYEMLAGRPPFTADRETPIAVMFKHVNEPVPPIPNTDAAIQQVVLRALAKEPSERFQSASDLARAFVAAVAPSSATVVQSTPAPTRPAPPSTAPPARSRRTWLVGGAIGAALLVLLAFGALGVRLAAGWITGAPTAEALPSEAPLSTPVPDQPTQAALVPVPLSEARFADAELDLSIPEVAPAPPGSVYALWFLRADGTRLEAMRFGGPEEALLIHLADPAGRNLLGQVDGLAVSLEASADSSSGPTVYQIVLNPEISGRVRALESVSREEPTSTSLRTGLPAQAGHFDGHLEFAVEAVRNLDLDAAKRHAEHMVNVAEGESGSSYGDLNADGRTENPGDAFGLIPYLSLLRDFAASASVSIYAEPEVQAAAAESLAEIDRLLQDAAFARDLGLRLAATDTAQEAAPLAEQLLALRMGEAPVGLLDSTPSILSGLSAEVLGLQP
jgi:serine/threonine-protein kinase